ncbi:zinc-dependent alcohol dehydrogenase family protein [Acetobacteraceae bacterium KSS8]|uniref:Zinc-dependent alcohol dehydrogenase family protein n=1 Tax=Endosaccharibacter trunci TaxID=2812733 RepID=A0ABT1WAM3_9PROT|nr:zinc-dependent alcohol dehydrogenase family protein [Acetobacteraceae bacterium KSS8]
MPRIVRFHETGAPDVLRLEDLPAREPGQDEVRITVHAIGLNRAEAMFRQGNYLEAPTLPAGLGYEAAGIVDAVGPGVRGVAVGDHVATIPSFSMNQYGLYGDVVIAPAHAVVAHPKEIGFETAAASWMQYVTAWGALHHIAGLRAGDTVLIPAATSSVGLAAIQICEAAGAHPVALTRSSAKRAALEDAAPGVPIIVTGEQDLVAETMRLTDGKGARIVFDPVGGPTLEKLCAAASQGGIVFQYGALSPEPTSLPLFTVLSKQLTVRGYTLFELNADRAVIEKATRYVLDGLASGALKPVISRIFPLEQVVDAHRFLESNEQIGKILLSVAP